MGCAARAQVGRQLLAGPSRSLARRCILLLQGIEQGNMRTHYCAAALAVLLKIAHECAQGACKAWRGCANKKALWPKPQGFVYLFQPLALGQQKD